MPRTHIRLCIPSTGYQASKVPGWADTQQLRKDLYDACTRNSSPGAQPKASDTKPQLIYQRVFCNYL